MAATEWSKIMNHAEVWAHEMASEFGSSDWERWAEKAESLLGHDLDGDENRDGFSLDGAHEAYKDGMSVRDYVSAVNSQKASLARY